MFMGDHFITGKTGKGNSKTTGRGAKTDPIRNRIEAGKLAKRVLKTIKTKGKLFGYEGNFTLCGISSSKH